MKLQPMNLPRPKRVPLITFREFADEVGVAWRTLSALAASSPTFPKYVTRHPENSWFVPSEIRAWYQAHLKAKQ